MWKKNLINSPIAKTHISDGCKQPFPIIQIYFSEVQTMVRLPSPKRRRLIQLNVGASKGTKKTFLDFNLDPLSHTMHVRSGFPVNVMNIDTSRMSLLLGTI